MYLNPKECLQMDACVTLRTTRLRTHLGKWKYKLGELCPKQVLISH